MRTSLLTVFPFVKVKIERTDVDMRNFELPANSWIFEFFNDYCIYGYVIQIEKNEKYVDKMSSYVCIQWIVITFCTNNILFIISHNYVQDEYMNNTINHKLFLQVIYNFEIKQGLYQFLYSNYRDMLFPLYFIKKIWYIRIIEGRERFI